MISAYEQAHLNLLDDGCSIDSGILITNRHTQRYPVCLVFPLLTGVPMIIYTEHKLSPLLPGTPHGAYDYCNYKDTGKSTVFNH